MYETTFRHNGKPCQISVENVEWIINGEHTTDKKVINDEGFCDYLYDHCIENILASCDGRLMYFPYEVFECFNNIFCADSDNYVLEFDIIINDTTYHCDSRGENGITDIEGLRNLETND